ncbi:hydroxyisourate hydrolase [Hymenobacter sp. BT175]|uniref:hydroxyisourate hydrolase n=1 Tax=Hymenobacter translucens TaxID=2886507 RepID=UPI001D0E2A26|nr:hydroxyisourate hydrolase [Hymenobacter translucens]MCC2545093.1 hydroxyisourate hydrolase [Hymenobacter translucens]
MSQITTHILDTTLGKPAQGVTIVLSARRGEGWQELARGVTNQDGRIANLLPTDEPLPLGIYQMRFETKEYFDRLGTAGFYPLVEIVFDVATTAHYHVPLLLNPFGYATYRGS